MYIPKALKDCWMKKTLHLYLDAGYKSDKRDCKQHKHNPIICKAT